MPNVISFDAPDDWEPIRITAFADQMPRFYVRLRTQIEPQAAAKVGQNTVAGPTIEVSYALG